MIKRDPAVLLLALGQTLTWASIFYAFPALLLRWEQDLGWSKTDLTGAITAAILVSALASPVSGRIIDRGFGKQLLAGAAALGGVCLLILSNVSTLWQFYAVWIVLGLAMAGSMYEPCFAIITRARGEKARRAITWITLIAGFAVTISFPMIHILSQAFGWRGAVMCLAGVMVFGVVPIFWKGASLLEQTARAQIRPTAPPTALQKPFLRQPAFWFLGLGFACLACVHSATLQHLLPILDTRGITPQSAILAAACIGPMQVVGRLALIASERALSNHGVALVGFFAMALSILLLLASHNQTALVAGFVLLFGSAYGTVSIIRPVLAREILGQANFGAKTGALAVPYLGGMAVAPYLGALIWRVGGYDLMLSVLIGLIGVGGVLYWQAHRTRLPI